jgi:hypothetical protein
MAFPDGQFTIVHSHALARLLHCNLPAGRCFYLVVAGGGRGADAATLAPLTYEMLVFATLIGFVVFGTIEIAEMIDI